MGFESGGRETRPFPSRKINVGHPSPKFDYFGVFFLIRIKILHFPTLKNKWLKSEEKLKFGGSYFL